jgi:hypothetical protein
MEFKTFYHFVATYFCLIPFLALFILYPLSYPAVWWKNRILFKDNDIYTISYDPPSHLPLAVAAVFVTTRREYGGVYWLVLITHICALSALFSIPFVKLLEPPVVTGMDVWTMCRYFFGLSGLTTFILYPLSLILVGRKSRTLPKPGDDALPLTPYMLTDDEVSFSPLMVSMVLIRRRKGFGGIYWLVLVTHILMLCSLFTAPFL